MLGDLHLEAAGAIFCVLGRGRLATSPWQMDKASSKPKRVRAALHGVGLSQNGYGKACL